MTIVMLVSTTSAYAYEGLSDVSNTTDYGNTGEYSSSESSSEAKQPNNSQGSIVSSGTSSSENNSNESRVEQPGITQPPQSDSDTKSEDESYSVPEQSAVSSASAADFSGLDPPNDLIQDGISFTVVLDSGADGRLRSAKSSSATIYLATDNSITYKYPFNGGNSTYPAYIFTTSTGEAAYCIEPARWNSINNDPVTGDLTYDKLSYSKQIEIAKAIACNPYGSGDHNYYTACQVIIWQIAYGQSYGSGSVYDAVIAANSAKLSSPYHAIISKMESAGDIPSFMSPDKNKPTQHTMTESGGSYSIDLKNTNAKVTLKTSDFKSRGNFNFNVNGNNLTVTTNAKPDQDAFVEWSNVAGYNTGLVFWSSAYNSDIQGKVSGSVALGALPGNGYMAFSSTALPPEVPPDIPSEKEPGLGYLQINKYDGTNNLPLGGAIFRVVTDAGFVNDHFPVEHGGSTIIIPIPADQDSVQATVTEIVAPDGFTLDSTPQTVTVTKNDQVNIAHVAFANYPKNCSLTIYKYETGNKGVALAGASFRIRYADPSVSAQTWTLTTDENGEINIDLPAAGALIVEELSAPAGYVMNTKTSYDVTVARGENKQLDVPNDKRAQLIVTKKDAQTGQSLAGAIIKVTLLRSHTPPFEQNISYTQTTGADGKTIFSGLIPGEYRIEEQSPPQYYLPTDVVHNVSIYDGNTDPVQVVFENQPWSGLTIKKVDSTNDKGLQGAVFKLYKGSREDPLAFLGDFETNENGVVVVPKLESGQYYTVVESQPPYGYLLDDEHHTQTIMIRPDAVENNITVIFRNKPKPKLLIKKIDEVTGEHLSGAVFRVSLKDSAEYKEYTTGQDGTVLIEGLDEAWYSVVEIRSPTNYILDNSIHNIQTRAGETTILSINNHRMPNLTIRKVDEQTGRGIPGVTLRVTKEGAKEFQDIVTGADGVFIMEHLTPGWYVITEQRVPETHILDQTPHYIEVKADQDTEIVIKNKAKPSLRIIKTDSVTKQPMQGVTFEISIKQGKSLGEFITDTNGEIFLPNIQPELYIIREVKTLDGYLIDTQQKEALVEWGKTTEVSFTNTPKNPLLIYKVDFHTGEPLAGAKFLVEKVNGEHVGEYVTGRNGYATVTGIEPGFYVVKEVQPPLNYILDETPQTVELKYDEPAIVRFEDKAMSGLHIVKVDSLTKEPMEGVSFRVSEKDGRTIGEYKTDAQGSILVENLQPGWYTIRETATLPNYILDQTPRDVEFVWGQLITVEFTNDRKAQLQVKKVDADTGEPLAGAKFSIETVGGEFLGEYTTDRTGFFTVDELNVDYVIVREIVAPDGFLLDNTPHTIKIEANKPAILELSNKRLSPIQIKKVDSETGAPLAGALFRINKANGELIGEFTSGTDGFINVPELAPGFYTCAELRCPDGYLLDQTPKTIEVKANIPTLVEFPNKQMPGLRVEKIDKVTGLPVGGAKFKVVRANGELIGEFTTNSAGFFMVSDINLNHQSVTIYETQAPKGYMHDPTPQTVELVPDKTTVVQFADQPLVGLQIKKVDDITGKPLAGVQFKVSELDGRTIGTYTTDDTGLIFIPDLAADSWVIVEEAKTLPGYKLDNAPRNVEIKGNKLNILEYRNQPYPNLLIKKTDAETGKTLEGVKFKLFDKFNREIGVFATNQLGQIHLTGMEAGTFYLQEIETNAGYVLDSTVREITLYWGKTTTIEVKNTPMGTLRVKKIDAITKKPIYGVTFNLYDLKNNLLGEFTTNNAGVIEFPKEIQSGKYLLKEVKAAVNYVLDSIPKTIEVKSGQTTEIVVENQPVLGKIQIIKKSAAYNDISKLPAGAFLKGAVFEIFNNRNEVVDRITTDDRGIATSKDLPAGEIFGVREVTAPDFYLKNDQVLYAEVKKTDDLIKFEILDANEDISVNVEKYGNIEAMPGDIIQYDFEEISNTSTISLNNFYWRDTIPTDAVHIAQIYTGTWSEHLDYKVLYKTNKKGWRTLAGKQYSGAADRLDCSREALRLGADEVVTEIKFDFKSVQAGFHQVDAPYILCQVNGDLPNEYRFTNKTDVGGQREDEWVIAKDQWTTIVYAKPKGKLPKTGKQIDLFMLLGL